MKKNTTQSRTILGTEIKFKFRPAMQDRKHLIVVFSGFRKIDSYDLDGASAEGLRANILWIQDNFSKNFSYYMRIGMETKVEQAVHSLIEETRVELGLEASNVTLAGFSKGGSAALFYGIKYNYGAILSVVPQFHIGSYVEKNWPQVHKHMTGTSSKSDTNNLDGILPSLVRSDENTNRNIYLFSSQADPQHKTEIVPYLEDLSKYSNFNYIETSSPVVDAHNIVTRYNIPLITSILSALTDNAIPKIGNVFNGSDNHHSPLPQPSRETLRVGNEAISAFTRLTVESNRLYPEGHAFLKGHEATSYSSIRVNLVLDNSGIQTHVPMGTVKNKNLSYQFFDSVYCDYSFANIASVGFNGVSLDSLPNGTSEILFHIVQDGQVHTTPATSTKTISSWSVVKSDLVHVSANSSQALITRRSPLGIESADSYFTLDELRISEKTIYIQGYFIQPGFATPNYGDVVYYLILSDGVTGKSEYVIQIASDNRIGANTKIDDIWHDYSKSYFATRGYMGVDISHIMPGEYTVHISARYGDVIFTKNTHRKFRFEVPKEIINLPKIAVIGSCVSRDIFNSQLAPKWRSLYTLQNQFYQSAIVSLMATPINDPAILFGDIDSHSREITVLDFEKSFIKQLIENPPTHIMIDLFADARFGILELGDSFVTNNAWKLQESEYYKKLEKPNAVSMQIDDNAYLKLFRDAVSRFKELHLRHFPDTRIIINKARAVSLYTTHNKIGRFSQRDVDSLNTSWIRLEDAFQEILEGDCITGMSDVLLGDGQHPWGPGPVHYQTSYYSQLQEQLRDLTATPLAIVEFD